MAFQRARQWAPGKILEGAGITKAIKTLLFHLSTAVGALLIFSKVGSSFVFVGDASGFIPKVRSI